MSENHNLALVKEIPAISLVKGTFRKAWGLSPPFSASLTTCFSQVPRAQSLT
jgi:hypothetical protein